MHSLEFTRDRFAICLEPDQAMFRLELRSFVQPLKIAIAVDTLAAEDREESVVWDGVSNRDDCERLSWTARSAIWSKRYHLDVHAEHVEFHAEIQGTGAVDTVRFFDGSATAFGRVFSPEPTFNFRPEFGADGYGQISVNGDADYGGGNFTANPGMLCFAVAAEHVREWLAFGLAVEPGEYLFSEYEYRGGDTFALALTSWGARRLAGSARTARIVMVPGDTAQCALSRYVDVLRAAGLVPTVRREQASWWSRPIVSGWGHQCYQADLWRIRSPAERPPDNAAYTLSTETNYRDLVNRLDAQDLPWGVLVIDARWFLGGGMKDVDVGRWPDLRAFVDSQHRRGRRVLLWWGPWDVQGVPPEQCVQYLPGVGHTRANRPGRVAKFGGDKSGDRLGVDISLPAVRDRIRDQVRKLVGRNGYDVDGFKIDHMAAAPGIYNMAFPEGSTRLFGIEAARSYLGLLHATVKDVKPDALLIGQSPNPYLADVQDMLRIGVGTADRHTVVPEATFGAEMARIVDPEWLIDTNGWPIPSMTAFREYVDVQPTLGVPSLYYTTHLDMTGEPLTAREYLQMRQAWSGL